MFSGTATISLKKYFPKQRQFLLPRGTVGPTIQITAGGCTWNWANQSAISVDWEGLQSWERPQWGCLLGCAGSPPGSFRDGAPTCATASAAELLLLRVASLPGDTTVQPSTGKQAPADKATPSVPTRSGGSRVRTVRTCYSYPTPDPPGEQLHWDLEAGCPGRVLMEAPKTGSLAAWVCLNISSSPGA